MNPTNAMNPMNPINPMNEKFEPKIVGFLCNWCTATAADLAGTTRIEYPPNIRPIRMMCSGSVDLSYVIRALTSGADGVLIGGCHPGECHYLSGNYKARRRVTLLKAILGALGLEEERIWIRWISASEGLKFADTIAEMTEALKKLGPNSLSKCWYI